MVTQKNDGNIEISAKKYPQNRDLTQMLTTGWLHQKNSRIDFFHTVNLYQK